MWQPHQQGGCRAQVPSQVSEEGGQAWERQRMQRKRMNHNAATVPRNPSAGPPQVSPRGGRGTGTTPAGADEHVALLPLLPDHCSLTVHVSPWHLQAEKRLHPAPFVLIFEVWCTCIYWQTVEITVSSLKLFEIKIMPSVPRKKKKRKVLLKN